MGKNLPTIHLQIIGIFFLFTLIFSIQYESTKSSSETQSSSCSVETSTTASKPKSFSKLLWKRSESLSVSEYSDENTFSSDTNESRIKRLSKFSGKKPQKIVDFYQMYMVSPKTGISEFEQIHINAETASKGQEIWLKN